MRVLLVTDFFPPVRGGLEFHVDLLAAELATRGHDVHVATVTPNPQPSSPAVTAHVIAPLYPSFIRYVDADRPFHPPVPDPKAVAQLRRLAAKIRPDVVHAHNLLGMSARVDRNVPQVFTAHDYGLVCQRRTLLRPDGGICGGPRLRDCVSCGTQEGSFARSTTMAAATMVGRRTLPADVVLAVSERVRAELTRFLRTPIEVVPGFIPPAPATPAPVAGLPGSPYVMYAGDPGAHKGVDLLLAIWGSADAPDAPLVLATTKPLQALTPDSVTALQLTRPQTVAAFAAAALVVVPSKWHEPFPTVAMEALAAGSPVIASDVGGLPDIVRDGVDGVLVPPADIDALRTAIAGLLADDPRRQRLGAAGRSGASRFAAETVVPSVEAVYERLVRAKAAA